MPVEFTQTAVGGAAGLRNRSGVKSLRGIPPDAVTFFKIVTVEIAIFTRSNSGSDA